MEEKEEKQRESFASKISSWKETCINIQLTPS